MSFRITRPYDSHTHLLGIGERLRHWDLKSLTEEGHFSQLPFTEKPHRGDFYMGFGWKLEIGDRQRFLNAIAHFLPTDKPVFLSRWDGHASIINAAAAQKLRLGSQIALLEEAEHFSALKALPDYSGEQLTALLEKAKEKLHQGGFTHFRDMTATLREVQVWSEILNKSQDAFIEFNFPVFKKSELSETVENLHQARKLSSRYIKVQGLKLFIDGTLGSQTAMTKCGCGSKVSLWTDEEIEIIITEAWNNRMDVAFHCIGELAVDQVVDCARQVLGKGITGRIHIEHCELLSKETLKKMKSIHVSVHTQPSHAIDDIPALQKAKIPEDVLVFPIETLQRNKIPVFFGSDAPVVESSMGATIQGLRALKFTKPDPIQKLLESGHSHPDSTSPRSELHVDIDGKIESLKFEDRELLNSKK